MKLQGGVVNYFKKEVFENISAKFATQLAQIDNVEETMAVLNLSLD